MQTHNLIQGTKEWNAHRADHFNASDAPAMMGCSAYKTRSQLLHEIATGVVPEVDASTQQRFDDGHRFEALARPLGEKIIGEELYPVVGSLGRYSASFDGLTMAEDKNFEHKSLNQELRECMEGEDEGDKLPLQYRVQMEQQHMVSGAEITLFMASKWDGDKLIEERHCWYHSDSVLRAKIVAGWDLFEKDLSEYVQPQVEIEAVGRTPESLPALHIEVTGMVTASNLSQFKEHALSVFKSINRELTTDQQFADADKTVKWCVEVEEKLKAAKQHALSQTESIDALFRTIDDIIETSRSTRLELDKMVKVRKESIRDEIVLEGKRALTKHLEALNVRLGKPYMPPGFTADFAGAIKGKRSIDSLRDAVGTMLANAKIDSNAIADMIQLNLTTLRDLAADYKALFPDTVQLVLKPNEVVVLTVKQRIADHKAEIEAEAEKARERIAAQEREKAEASTREEAQRQERERTQEQRDIEEAARVKAAVVQKVDTAATLTTVAPAAQPAPVKQAIAPKPTTPPSLPLGEISSRLGFNVTSAFLSALGFEATTVRTSKFYHEAEFLIICEKISGHIVTVMQQFESA